MGLPLTLYQHEKVDTEKIFQLNIFSKVDIEEQEIDALFFALQSEHRKAQAELNGMKNEIERRIDEDWRRKNDKWVIEHDKWANDLVNLKERIMREKEARSREIENLKIAIPDSLKPIYEKIRTL